MAQEMEDLPLGLNIISGAVVDSAIGVHRTLGPGLLESTYRRCLAIELTARGHLVRQEVGIPLRYRGETIQDAFRIDLLVDEKVVVELKAVDAVQPVHEAQLLTYLRLGGFPLGLLLNFNVPRMIDGVHRRVASTHWRPRGRSIWDSLDSSPP